MIFHSEFQTRHLQISVQPHFTRTVYNRVAQKQLIFLFSVPHLNLCYSYYKKKYLRRKRPNKNIQRSLKSIKNFYLVQSDEFYLHQTITATIVFYTLTAYENRCKRLNACMNIYRSLKSSKNWLQWRKKINEFSIFVANSK